MTCYGLCLTWLFFLQLQQPTFSTLHSLFTHKWRASFNRFLNGFVVCSSRYALIPMSLLQLTFTCHHSNTLLLDRNGADSSRLTEQRKNHSSQRHCSMYLLQLLSHSNAIGRWAACAHCYWSAAHVRTSWLWCSLTVPCLISPHMSSPREPSLPYANLLYLCSRDNLSRIRSQQLASTCAKLLKAFVSSLLFSLCLNCIFIFSNLNHFISNSQSLLNYGISVANHDFAPCGKDTVEESMPLCTYPINT